MKIGIMSMQRIKNYGSFLQAYSLKKVLESSGNTVEFVDYHVNKNIDNADFKQKYNLKNVLAFIKHRSNSKKRELYVKASTFDDAFEAFFSKLSLTNEPNYNTDLDLLVIGSDEVFNCYQTHNGNILSEDLFAKNNKSEKVISYAASFGTTTLELINKYGDVDVIKDGLSRFEELSVRDKNSFEIVKSMIGKEPLINLDPVFIYDYSDEMLENTPKVIDEPYMVVYGYRGRFSAEEGRTIKKYAKKNGLKIISLEGVQDFCDDFIVANPFEVLNYIKNANCVVTDTFHGTVFSIKFNKKFATFVRESNKQKLTDLLNKFSFSNHIVYELSNLESVLGINENYSVANDIIEFETKKAKEYLFGFCGL